MNMTHDDNQDDHDWDDLLKDRHAIANHVVKCPRCGKDKWKFLGGGPEPPCGPCWQALYDESTEPPKAIPLHAESPRWRHEEADRDLEQEQDHYDWWKGQQ